MRGTRRYIAVGGVCLLVVGVAWLALGLQRRAAATPGVPDTEDSRLIQETIHRSYELQQQAVLTADTSAFNTVFVNDPRGEPLSARQIARLQRVTGLCTKSDFGYLDLQVDSYTVRSEAEEATLAQNCATAGSVLPVVPPGGHVILSGPPELRFISIVIEGDQAQATFESISSVREMLLVKLEGRWLIAGGRVLRASL